MDRRRAAGALLALAACIACSTAAPTASNQTALEPYEGPTEGCYYNFQHYGEGDRIMTNEPCLNCTCHNRMLMCYLKVCPFTKPIGQDCTIEKRADQCCPIITCPDVPVDLLTSTSTSSPAEYGATGLGKVDKYGCSISGKYFPEGSKVPPTPNKPCEHCYCIRNMTTCVMQECTLHVDGCTPIYNKDVCCPVRYSCDHLEDETLLLDDMTTTVRPTPGFLLTTTTMPSVTQISQNCVHDDQIFADGALIKTEIACEHCYCMKGDIVCVVQECGTPMENEGKNCTSLRPRQGQCCPDTYICEGDEVITEATSATYEELTTLSPPRRVEGSGYRNEPDEPYTELPTFEGSGEEHATTLDSADILTSQKQTPQIIDEMFGPTQEPIKPSLTTIEPDKEQNTVPDDSYESASDSQLLGKTTITEEATTTAQPSVPESIKETDMSGSKTPTSDHLPSSESDSFISKEDEFIMTTESLSHYTKDESNKITEMKPDVQTTEKLNIMDEVVTQQSYLEPSSSEASTAYKQDDRTTSFEVSEVDEVTQSQETTPVTPKDDTDIHDKEDKVSIVTTIESITEPTGTTSVNPVENEIDEDILPPGRIPGEGDCLLNGVTYKNSTNVPNINNCHSSCKCVSSIVKCDPIICSPPPEHMENMNDCQPIYDTPDACCPTYICHSRETVPPESHSQMSGTESPKPPTEIECHDGQCQSHETEPISFEPCNSDSCKPVMEDHDKECKNGGCENTEISSSTKPPPLQHPDSCIGDTCIPSAEICSDGKCQPSSIDQTICDNENGCQSSEACEGNDCVIGPEVTVIKDELPICKDSDDCKVTDTSSCEGSTCTSTEGTQVPDKDIVQSECKEESCRRKDQPEVSESSSQCVDSTCIAQGMGDESGNLSTESVIKEQDQQESTTEVVRPSDEAQKVTNLEATTENKDISLGYSTGKPKELPTEGISQETEKGETYTESSVSYATKIQEISTEIYKIPDTEDHQTFTPDTDTTSKEQATESVEDIAKQTFTDSPITTQYDKHPSDLPKDVSEILTKPSEDSTEKLDIEPQDQTDKDYVTDTSVVKDFTEAEEISTKPTNILETTSKVLETTEQEYTNKQEMFTESPKEEQTVIVSQDSVITESDQNVFNTESSVTLLSEMTTKEIYDVGVKDNEVTPGGEHTEIINIPVETITEQTVQIIESSEPNESKLDASTTKTFDNEIDKDHISTENPAIFTEVIPTDTTIHELYKVDEKTEYPQTTDSELPMSTDTSRKTTESLIEDQEKLSKPTDTYDSVPDEQDTHTIPNKIQEHDTTVSSIIDSTESSTINDNIVTPMHDISDSQKDGPNVPESPIKESPISTIPQEIDIKQIATQQPGISTIDMQEVTTEMSDVHAIQTVSDKVEDHTDISVEDINEVSTTAPEETFQDDSKGKEPSVIKPIDEAELGTTISSILTDKDHDLSTKYTDAGSDMEPNKESTTMPEVHSTKSEESTSLYAETEKKTSSTSQVTNEAVTTESSNQPYEDNKEIPDLTHTNTDERTLPPTISYTETYDDSDDKATPMSIDESKTQDKPQYTTPETVTDAHITEGAENDVKGTESSKEPEEPITYTVSNEIDVQHIVTQAAETTTQPQDTDTNLATELQSNEEIPSTPTHVVKEEKGQTESPMSLITEPLSMQSEDVDHSVLDKTTQIPQEKEPDDEIKTPDSYETKPQTSYTESPQLDTSSQIYTEKESQPESPHTTSSEAYTTVNILDIQNKETLPTEVGERLVPTTLNQDTMFTQTPIKSDSESYPTSVSHEPTSEAPAMVSPEESVTTEQEETSTRYPEMTGSVTIATYDHEPDTKPENIPVKDYTLEDATGQPQINIDYITTDRITSETLNENLGDTQQNDKINDVKDSEITIPTESTIKYSEILEKTEDKETGEPKPDKQDEYTETPESRITTESIISPEQQASMNPVTEIQTVNLDHEKSTEVPQTSDEKDVTTPIYQDSTTPKKELIADLSESHLITGDMSTTESSEISSSDESNRRTHTPTFETVLPDQYTTEKPKDTELPEITKPVEMGETDITEETSSNAPEKESTTLFEEFEHVTSIPVVTEGNIVLVTETVPSYQDQYVPRVTESIEKYTTEKQEPETDLNVNLPSETDKDTVTEKTTVRIDFTNKPTDVIPIEIPSEHTVSQESHTETLIPIETEISEPTTTKPSVPLDIENDLSVPTETNISDSEATEPSILKETEILVPEVTEGSVDKETESGVSKVTEAFVPIETEVAISDITETSVSQKTEATLKPPEETESSSHKVPEVSVSEITEPSVTESSKVTEVSQPEITEGSGTELSKTPEDSEATVPEITEASVPKVTEATVTKITEGSIPEISKATISEITEESSTEVTEGSVSEETEGSMTEVTKTSVSEVTETTAVKETESDFINRESEGTTYKTSSSKEESPTMEPIHSSSETTPYLVELQEHTTRVDEDNLSVSLAEEDRTKGPEIYQTERGDQPLDNVSNKFTEEGSYEEHTTKETFTKKDEQLITLPPEQASAYTEKLSDKTEVATEEVSISSESTISTLLNAEISTQTSSGEQSITMSPTASVLLHEQDKHTTAGFEIETTSDKKDIPLSTEKTPELEVMHEATSTDDAHIPVVTQATTIKIPEEITTHLPEDKPSESHSPTIAPDVSKPGGNEIQPAEELPSPDFPPSGSSGYGQEPDYVEEDQAFGPGTCRYGGKVYVSAQQIPRDDPCDFCFCFRSDIICLQQSCPPPIHGCHEEPIQGFCCPRYECPVSMATTLNVTTTTTTTTTTLPPHFLPHAYKGAAQRRGCQIKGHSYKVGEVVRASSGPCLHCTCGGDGQMKCDPKACTPEPMLRQMIAAAVSAKRRR